MSEENLELLITLDDPEDTQKRIPSTIFRPKIPSLGPSAATKRATREKPKSLLIMTPACW